MKVKKLLALLVLVVALIGSACATQTNFDGQIKVTFCLEGGVYQNSKRDVVVYYPASEENFTIVTPDALSGKPIEKSGYYVEGWYTEKTVNGETVAYSGKWDFNSDKVDSSGITLYANWVEEISYSYEVCYYNAQNEVVVLGSYPVQPGEVFEDFANFAKKRTDGLFTPLKYLNEQGEDWDYSFTHPGGEESLAIRVFVEYIEGSFELISTAEELKKATNKNIYLLNDIDLGGAEINFGNYKNEFIGNGHKITNFKISYNPARTALKEDIEDSSKKSLYISLFGNANGATVKDVTFENVTVEINTTLSTTYKIYLAPLVANATNSLFEKVTFSGTYTVVALPKDRVEDEMLVVKTSEPAIVQGENLTFTNVSVSLAKQLQN